MSLHERRKSVATAFEKWLALIAVIGSIIASIVLSNWVKTLS
jgi:hypothetical protein